MIPFYIKSLEISWFHRRCCCIYVFQLKIFNSKTSAKFYHFFHVSMDVTWTKHLNIYSSIFWSLENYKWMFYLCWKLVVQWQIIILIMFSLQVRFLMERRWMSDFMRIDYMLMVNMEASQLCGIWPTWLFNSFQGRPKVAWCTWQLLDLT